MTHVALENSKKSNIKKILATMVFNDGSQLQERKSIIRTQFSNGLYVLTLICEVKCCVFQLLSLF